MELEQELVNFFISNTQYDRQFIYDLFNILKNHLGESVKVTSGGYGYWYYYAMTDNFYIKFYFHSDPNFDFVIVYKNIKINLVYSSTQYFYNYIYKIEHINKEKLKLYFDKNDYISFAHTLLNLKLEECNKKLRDVFIPTIVKSARK